MSDQIKVEPYVNTEGKIAVMYSPGYGAGWSTWNDSKYSRYLCQDKSLVEMKLQGVESDVVEEYLEKTLNENYICTLGWESIEIVYLYPGTQYRISEYDGSESVTINNDEYWNLA